MTDKEAQYIMKFCNSIRKGQTNKQKIMGEGNSHKRKHTWPQNTASLGIRKVNEKHSKHFTLMKFAKIKRLDKPSW